MENRKIEKSIGNADYRRSTADLRRGEKVFRQGECLGQL